MLFWAPLHFRKYYLHSVAAKIVPLLMLYESTVILLMENVAWFSISNWGPQMAFEESLKGFCTQQEALRALRQAL